MAAAGGGAPLQNWYEFRELFWAQLPEELKAKRFAWENLPLPAPPDQDETLTKEIKHLHDYQLRLMKDPLRQSEILDQATTEDISDILRPMGIEELGGYGATETLIRTVIDVAGAVGFHYKDKFSRTRPNLIDPTLRPFVGNPPHNAYPSNHTFQMYSVAEVLSRMVPEVGAMPELFFVAQRVGENREYAGIHYPSDTDAGRLLAKWFCPYMIELCREQVFAAMQEWI